MTSIPSVVDNCAVVVLTVVVVVGKFVVVSAAVVVSTEACTTALVTAECARQGGGAGMEVSARRSATLPGRPLCAGGVYRRSSHVSLCSLRALLVPWTRTSTGQRSFAADGPRTWNRVTTALRSPELSLASFKRQLKTHLSVPALDSAGCSCGCRVPSSGAVVTVQRVRRRLQMSRLDSRNIAVFYGYFYVLEAGVSDVLEIAKATLYRPDSITSVFDEYT